MATIAQDIIGLEAYSRDGDKIGRVKRWISCRGSDLKWVVIRCTAHSAAKRDYGPGVAGILRSAWALPRFAQTRDWGPGVAGILRSAWAIPRFQREEDLVVPVEAVEGRQRSGAPVQQLPLEASSPRLFREGNLSRGELARLERYYDEAAS
jgi:hypothetical protein